MWKRSPGGLDGCRLRLLCVICRLQVTFVSPLLREEEETSPLNAALTRGEYDQDEPLGVLNLTSWPPLVFGSPALVNWLSLVRYRAYFSHTPHMGIVSSATLQVLCHPIHPMIEKSVSLLGKVM